MIVISAAFFLVTVCKKAAETTFVRKIRTYNIDEIDRRSDKKEP